MAEIKQVWGGTERVFQEYLLSICTYHTNLRYASYAQTQQKFHSLLHDRGSYLLDLNLTNTFQSKIK